MRSPKQERAKSTIVSTLPRVGAWVTIYFDASFGQTGSGSWALISGAVSWRAEIDAHDARSCPRQTLPWASSMERSDAALWKNHAVQNRLPSSGPGGL